MIVLVYSMDGERVAEQCLSRCAGVVLAIRGQCRFDVDGGGRRLIGVVRPGGLHNHTAVAPP